MAKEIKPSIYSDRGTIGSSSELDEYGVWVKSEPQVLSSANIETLETPDTDDMEDIDFGIPEIEDLPDFDADEPEFSEEDSAQSADESEEEIEFGLPELVDENEEENGVDLDFDEPFEIPEVVESEEEAGEGFTEVSMDEFIGTLDAEPEALADVTEETSVELAAEEPMELPLVEFADISEEAPEEKSTHKPAAAQQDLSTQLLMKIAEELASIRTELSTLKREFSGARTAAPEAETGENGFFDEEDDEKISLTGDELNNILNTADFTEEAGADATAELSEDLTIRLEEDSADDFSSEQELALPEVISEELPEPDSEEFEISMDLESLPEEETTDNISVETAANTEEAFPSFDVEETDELKQIREDGAEPMTSAPDPDDANYLAEDPLVDDMDESLSIADLDTEIMAEEIPADLSMDMSMEPSEDVSGESIDFSEAVIDEPDLSADIQDNPLEEPSLEDISIHLDLDDNAFDIGSEEQEETEELSLSDISVELDSAEESADISAEEPVESADSGDMELESADFEDLELIVEPELTTEPELTAEPEVAVALELSDGQKTEAGEIDSGVDLTLIPEGFVVESEGADESADKPGEEAAKGVSSKVSESSEIPSNLKHELKTVLSYMDQLLESLPDDKIEEFARSEHYDTYKRLFKELGLV